MIITFTLPALGHIYPTLPVIRELVRRGERVVYYCGEAMRSVIEATGAEFRPMPEDPEKEVPPDSPSLNWVANTQLRITAHGLPRLLEEIKAEAPTFLLVDFMCVWGRFAGQALGLPVVIFSSTLALAPGMLPPWPVFTAVDVGPSLHQLRLLAQFRRRAAQLAERFGVDRLRLPMDILRMDSDRILVVTSRMFQPNAYLFDERFHFVGPCFEPRQGDAYDELPALDDRPLIYVSLGTLYNQKPRFFQSCVEAFRDDRYQVLMSIGRQGDPAALGATPAHVHVRRFVPQLEVLRRASLFITHGGLNSTSEALMHEVPLLVHPQGADQFTIAKRVEELGVGRRLQPWQMRPAQLRQAVDQLISNGGVRARCRTVRQSFIAAGGTARAADILQEFQASLTSRKDSSAHG